MKYPLPATAAWLGVVAAAFALGWKLKPPDRRIDGVGASASSAPLTPPSLSSRRHSLAAAAGGVGQAAEGTADRPLTSADIAALGKAFRTATDPIIKLDAFATLLAGRQRPAS
jgi:hypothetical protein